MAAEKGKIKSQDKLCGLGFHSGIEVQEHPA